ncbi:hypothetical protein [Tautonia rosea]|uniref:hypothetical protein n=1 Tax=Tautonia rosea TaxID=2728037 RepID=UPI0014756355|nr:hypothetical protein [Tautonia rosea]
MAATMTQILANRLNALRSTGPKTDSGKDASSRNALKHGLSQVGTRPPSDMAAAIAERKTLWAPDYRPEGPSQTWVFERLVAESVRLDACEARLLAAREELALTASESWDDDRAAVASSLGSRLAAQPDRIQPLLLQNKHGVLWLLDRWAEVADSISRHDGWTVDTWQRALDLLGLPSSARDGTGPWDLDPEDNTACPGLALVSQAVEALSDRLDAYLNARDTRHRLNAEAGLSALDPAPIRLLERYAADARRRILFCTNELRRLQSDRGRVDSCIAHAPTSDLRPPGPRPDRDPRGARCNPEPPPPSQELAADPNAPGLRSPNEASSDRVQGRGSLRRSVLPGASVPLNRRARRARNAAARRS